MNERKFKSKSWKNQNGDNNPEHGPDFEFSRSILLRGIKILAEISGRLITCAWLLICL